MRRAGSLGTIGNSVMQGEGEGTSRLRNNIILANASSVGMLWLIAPKFTLCQHQRMITLQSITLQCRGGFVQQVTYTH